jgi:hypothetical protein
MERVKLSEMYRRNYGERSTRTIANNLFSGNYSLDQPTCRRSMDELAKSNKLNTETNMGKKLHSSEEFGEYNPFGTDSTQRSPTLGR